MEHEVKLTVYSSGYGDPPFLKEVTAQSLAEAIQIAESFTEEFGTLAWRIKFDSTNHYCGSYTDIRGKRRLVSISPTDEA